MFARTVRHLVSLQYDDGMDNRLLQSLILFMA